MHWGNTRNKPNKSKTETKSEMTVRTCALAVTVRTPSPWMLASLCPELRDMRTLRQKLRWSESSLLNRRRFLFSSPSSHHPFHRIRRSLSTPCSVIWTQPRAWGTLDWRWENSVGLSECPWAQRCHPWPLSLVEWVHQGWRDALSGESRLWRVNICPGISTCCVQWLANCWFAGVIPFSNSRKGKSTYKINISALSLIGNHSWYSWLNWGFSFQSRSEMFERPRESRPVFLDVQGHAWSPPPLGSAAAQPTWAQFLATPRPFWPELPLYTLLPLTGELSSQNPVPSRPRWDDPSSGRNPTYPWKSEISCSSLPLFSLWHCLY